MKILKGILLTIVALIAIALVTALFVKKEYAVEKEVTVNKPKAEVFEYIKFLKNQDKYSVWNMRDPESVKTFTGTDGTLGYIAAWDSKVKEVGIGEQEIKTIIDGERIDSELRFKKPFENTNNAYITTTLVNDSTTKVTWGFNGKMKYPMNIFLLMLDMDEMLGNDLQNGLNNLKSILEK
jgi:uncharacterized membrane protein